ncbi:MAG TPA: SPFH domain-containing protein [Bryobacteraceae bacterium]|jgi:regulator of protease activity HflC (stomatin/prohibitin superfamily)|nr:SPFH domain-containing protein [Bryobacteraceae bacterium]
MLVEKDVKGFSGWLMLFLLAAVSISSVTLMIVAIQAEQTPLLLIWIPVFGAAILCFFGLTVVNPNQAKVVLLFGTYKGSIKEQGFWWVNPVSTRRKVSLRIRNFESSKLKVNDQDGNPIEIAAVVVWKVVDTAEAVFQVDDYEHFVHVQSEAALRNLATRYPYDSHREGDMSLRMSVLDIAHQLRDEIQERLAKAGVEVIEARITHLAYASEIASAMLRRQQANAIIAARQKIVEGAVGMVEMALEQLSAKHVVELDEERKASMVSNLLVVLCSDRDAQPIVNAGTLYQ